jgi:hypothetical protein
MSGLCSPSWRPRRGTRRAQAGELRLWLGKSAGDDTAAAAIVPDQVWTHARDAAPSTIGALIIVEVKKPGRLSAAVAQAARRARRRAAALFHRGRRAWRDGATFALAVATDGASVAVLRKMSGAPADGDFATAQPCPRW